MKGGLSSKYHNDRNRKLIDIIDKPEWYINKTERSYLKETLIPDLISVVFDDNKGYFAIFDAKYYCVNANRSSLNGNPGIESVTKQYLYQQAYSDFIDEHGLEVYNSFLFPTEKNEVIDLGTVKLEMLSKLELKDILLRELPAEEMYAYYLKNRHKNPIEVLNLQ